jgi:hypothetical protein
MPNRNPHRPSHLIVRLGLLLAALAIALPPTAAAYVDPGTGSFLVQGIIAAVVGVGVAVRMFWGRIKRAITGRAEPRDEDDDV